MHGESFAVDEIEFWRIIELLNWKRTGDDEAVLKPAVRALAKKSPEEIAGFEEIMSQKLFALDTMAHARQMGEDAYIDDKHPFSVDAFLYARCCVVANGKEYYESVLADAAEFPEDIDFEALLELASTAYESSTGRAPDSFETSVSYETFSNKVGWES
jgi:hypothetical protein